MKAPVKTGPWPAERCTRNVLLARQHRALTVLSPLSTHEVPLTTCILQADARVSENYITALGQ